MNVKAKSFYAMMFVIGAAYAYADNEVYIDQVGNGGDIGIVRDGSGNKLGGGLTDTSKFLLDGADMDFKVNLTGGSNNLIGSIIGTSTGDIDVSGSSNDLLFDVDKDNS